MMGGQLNRPAAEAALSRPSAAAERATRLDEPPGLHSAADSVIAP